MTEENEVKTEEITDEVANSTERADEAIIGTEATKLHGKRKFNTRKLVLFAVFLALVIVLQVFGTNIKIGATSISLVLIPIVLGGVLMGPLAGATLGFTFGLITLISGVVGTDAFTAILFMNRPVLTSFLCLGKGLAAGLVAALIYKLIAGKNGYAAIFAASAAAPIVNTGLFILGALLMSDTLRENFIADGMTVMYFLVIVCAGINFLIEFAVNMVVSPALYSLAKIYKARRY